MQKVVTLIGVLALAAVPAAAQSAPSVSTILQKMKEVFEPARPSTRTMTITINNEGEATNFVARQARKKTDEGKRMATVVLDPADLRGSAFLVAESKQPMQPPIMWIYAPFTRRVRKLITVDGFEHFMGTDFTYSDLGFVHLHKRDRLLGTEQHAGTTAYKVEEKLSPDEYYYSHIIVWVAQDTMLPLERDYYSPGGDLWKKEVFDSVSTIDGVPTIMHVKMSDLLQNTSSEIKVTQIKYDVDVSDTLFDPTKLPKLVDDSMWPKIGGTP